MYSIFTFYFSSVQCFLTNTTIQLVMTLRLIQKRQIGWRVKINEEGQLVVVSYKYSFDMKFQNKCDWIMNEKELGFQFFSKFGISKRNSAIIKFPVIEDAVWRAWRRKSQFILAQQSGCMVVIPCRSPSTSCLPSLYSLYICTNSMDSNKCNS